MPAPRRAATQGDEAVAGYLRYCREQGMNYKMEIHDQLQGGLYTYKVACLAPDDACLCMYTCTYRAGGTHASQHGIT
jgi:hypothetical protein